MCGIAGIFNIAGRDEVDGALLRRMTDALAHRGPDGEGFYSAAGIGLGHRRLAIIDLAGGEQPLFNEDRTVCVVFNGEIYNFQPLMEELARLGHRFRTRCDTEVIVHAWEEWGEACLDRFNGMFAFALWDGRSETLFLARDRLGEKPLYYADTWRPPPAFRVGAEVDPARARSSIGNSIRKRSRNSSRSATSLSRARSIAGYGSSNPGITCWCGAAKRRRSRASIGTCGLSMTAPRPMPRSCGRGCSSGYGKQCGCA